MIIEINKDIDLSKLHKEILSVYPNFSGVTVTGNSYVFDGLEEGDDIEMIIEAHSPLVLVADDFYDKTQIDGRRAVNQLMKELRENALANNIPRIVNATIEDSFKPVTDALLWGWWLTAREKLDTVPISAYVSQELWDRIKDSLDSYIAENYG